MSRKTEVWGSPEEESYTCLPPRLLSQSYPGKPTPPRPLHFLASIVMGGSHSVKSSETNIVERHGDDQDEEKKEEEAARAREECKLRREQERQARQTARAQSQLSEARLLARQADRQVEREEEEAFMEEHQGSPWAFPPILASEPSGGDHAVRALTQNTPSTRSFPSPPTKPWYQIPDPRMSGSDEVIKSQHSWPCLFA